MLGDWLPEFSIDSQSPFGIIEVRSASYNKVVANSAIRASERFFRRSVVHQAPARWNASRRAQTPATAVAGY
jgi:hypothetical protein